MDEKDQEPTPIEQLDDKPSQAEGDVGDDDVTDDDPGASGEPPASPAVGDDSPGK